MLTACAYGPRLLQHGKNYAAIERYMSGKDRAYAKNYEQIRHHYYNTVKLLRQQVPLHNKECKHVRAPTCVHTCVQSVRMCVCRMNAASSSCSSTIVYG